MFTIPHKNSLLIVFLSMVFSTIAWILVLMRADPFSSTAWPQVVFFLSLFFMVSSALTLAGYFGRLFLYRGEIFFSHLTTSLRQGLLGGILMGVSLYFQHIRVLNWWNLLLLIVIMILLEVFFLSREE